jgi:septum formation protein
MRSFDAEEIDHYLAAGESMDKAGAYSIQGEGRNLITAMRGDYLAAVGMPLRPIADYLKYRDVNFDCDIGRIYRTEIFQNWPSFD